MAKVKRNHKHSQISNWETDLLQAFIKLCIFLCWSVGMNFAAKEKKEKHAVRYTVEGQAEPAQLEQFRNHHYKAPKQKRIKAKSQGIMESSIKQVFMGGCYRTRYYEQRGRLY